MNKYLLCYTILNKLFDKIKRSDIEITDKEYWAFYTTMTLLLKKYILTKKYKKRED